MKYVQAQIITLTCGLAMLTSHAFASDPIEVFTEPYQVIELAAPEAGILESMHVRQGDMVQAGDLVANLDRDVLLMTLEIAKHRAGSQAALNRTRADVQQKERRYQKLVALHRNGHASEEEIDSARTSLEIAQAGLLEAQENSQLALLQMREIEAQLRRRSIRSPIRGQVVKIEKDQGEYVASIEPVVARIVQLDRLRVKFYVDTRLGRMINKGEVLPLLLVDSNESTEGVVEFVSPTTEADSRTVRVEVVIENADGKYRSGVPVRLSSIRQARGW